MVINGFIHTFIPKGFTCHNHFVAASHIKEVRVSMEYRFYFTQIVPGSIPVLRSV